MQTAIQLPYKFEARPYQLPIFWAMDAGGYKRAVLVWHRRAGKDHGCLNLMIKKMYERVGNYYYVYPTQRQGRKAIWDNITKGGRRFLDFFPKELIAGEPNSTEMKIRFKNGSIFQIVGSDDIDNLLSTNPVGIVMSEFSVHDPRAWDYLSPIIEENGGWVIFNFTPRGYNHAYDLFEMACKDPRWFVQKLTIDDTGVYTKEQMDQQRREGKSEEFIQQEYFTNFESSLVGSYYAKQINAMVIEKRIKEVPYEPMMPVHTFWDLGVGDRTCIGFFQHIGMEWRMIDCYDNHGEGLEHYIKILQEKPYVYKDHWAPHDIRVKEFGTGKTRYETARGLGVNFRIVPKIDIEDGINAARMALPTLWIDKTRCAMFIRAMKEYTHEWDEQRECFADNPLHDWTSDFADMFRYFAVSQRYVPDGERAERQRKGMMFGRNKTIGNSIAY